MQNLLKKGDRIAIVATARKVLPQEIEKSVKVLNSWGLDVVVPDGLYDVDNQFAGNDAHRASIMQEMLDDDSVQAVLCARGGYGTVRIIDRLDFSHFNKSPKWVVGYSDVTVLHNHIHRQCGVPTIHAVNGAEIGEHGSDSPAVLSLKKFLFEGSVTYDFIHPEGIDTVSNRVGECVSPIVGGNLSILYSLLGSASEIDTDGKILFIEDLDEYLYHVDRMVVAMKRAGKFDKIKGLIVGSFNKMHDNAVPFGHSAEEIVMDAVKEYDFPVAFYCQFGHIGAENHALPLGVTAKITVDENKVKIII